MGKKNKNKQRLIVVEFASIWDHRKLYAASTELKTRGFEVSYINEDMSKEQAEILFNAR